VCVCVNAASPSMYEYQTLCLVCLTRYEPDAKTFDSLHKDLLDISKVRFFLVSCILMWKIRFCNCAHFHYYQINIGNIVPCLRE
jgi:hypothetical protein